MASKPIDIDLVTSDRVQERFWAKVDKSAGPDGCWVWRGTVATDGYGVFKIRPKMYRAHRLAYVIAHGLDPESLVIRHSCNNPLCVNHAHLSTGEVIDNIADMVISGRTRTGKFDKHDVIEIRRRSSIGDSHELIASDYGVEPRIVQFAVSGKTYWHIREGLSPSVPHPINKKGRHIPSPNGVEYRLSGEKQPNAKLTNEQAREIREYYESGVGTTALSGLYQISVTSVGDIVAGRSYREAGGSSEIRKRAKLDPESVREIRRHANRVTISELSKTFGVTTDSIKNVIERKTWKHVA